MADEMATSENGYSHTVYYQNSHTQKGYKTLTKTSTPFFLGCWQNVYTVLLSFSKTSTHIIHKLSMLCQNVYSTFSPPKMTKTSTGFSQPPPKDQNVYKVNVYMKLQFLSTVEFCYFKSLNCTPLNCTVNSLLKL